MSLWVLLVLVVLVVLAVLAVLLSATALTRSLDDTEFLHEMLGDSLSNCTFMSLDNIALLAVRTFVSLAVPSDWDTFDIAMIAADNQFAAFLSVGRTVGLVRAARIVLLSAGGFNGQSKQKDSEKYEELHL